MNMILSTITKEKARMTKMLNSSGLIKEEKDELFLQFWTRKECYSKADGRGLGIGLNQIKTDWDGFYSKWLDDETFLSMYVEDGDYQDLQIEEIKYV